MQTTLQGLMRDRMDRAQAPLPLSTPGACAKCHGTGAFIGYSGRRVGDCFSCKGTGVYAPPAAAPAVDVSGLEQAFAKAAAAGLKRIGVKLGSLRITPAKATSANPGALYVKDEGTYLGKVAGGVFRKSWDCSPEQSDRVLSFLADPKGQAEAYGQETGECCICSRELTDPESIARGIGPICAERFGW